MAVRFVIGRAGAGKTYHCLEAVRSALREDPIRGKRLILLVPEQAGLQTERAVLQPADIPAAHRVDVLSFQRLAYKVLDSTGGLTQAALSEPARAMVLRHLLSRQAGRLRYYRKVERLGGFVERLGATITELIQEEIQPDELAAFGERSGRADGVQSAKLHDLRLIYAAYLDYLGRDRLDPSQHLKAARERLGRCEWLLGARVWVDGFASLSGQERCTLVELARICQCVDIALLMDPDTCDPAPEGGRSSPAAGLFRKTERTYHELCRVLEEAGIAVEEPLLLKPERLPRFSGCDALTRLERSLVGVSNRTVGHGLERRGITGKMPVPHQITGKMPVPHQITGKMPVPHQITGKMPVPHRVSSGAPDSFRGTSTAEQGSSTGVEVVELCSRRVEVDYAVSRVIDWVRQPGDRYRFRDIAIIARDLDIYHDLLGEALCSRGIPYFIDRRRPIAHHPLVELIRSAMAMAAQNLSLESIRPALKTGLLPIGIEDADELENYCLAHGIAGSDGWRAGDWAFTTRSSFVDENEEPDDSEAARLAHINETRREFLEAVEPWLAFASIPKGHSGSAWASTLTDWLMRLDVGQTLKRWSEEALADGDADQAAEHSQVFRDSMSFLDDLAFALADVTLTAEELSGILESGLSSLTLGLAPPMIDQVLVGSIERSRHPNIKAAVILGFNDGVLPKQPVEDSILNDDDRGFLREGGVSVGPPTRTRVLEEALLVYIALTRASESCVITYATADNDGKALRPSPYLAGIRESLPFLRKRTIGDPSQTREAWDILSPSDLPGRLAMEFRARSARDPDDPSIRRRWNELYDRSRLRLRDEERSKRVMRSLSEGNEAALSPASVERVFAGPLRTSVSQLETYAACPFQYFARYILRLKERAEATLAPVDVGQLHHAILEDFVNGLSARGETFAGLSEGELLEGLQESCGRLATRLPPGGTISNARNAYMLRRSAAQLARVIRAQRKVSQSGTSRPRATEVPFGFNRPGGLPALELSTPAGRRVFLRGFIDRVDVAEVGDELLGIVIDYKRTPDKKLNLGNVYHGLSLQLLAYLLALAEGGETLAGRPIRPIAGLYVSLALRYHLVDHPGLDDSREVKLGGSYRPRGLVLADGFPALDRDAESGWSKHYSVYRRKDGGLGHIDSSDAAPAASFDAMLDHTRSKLGQLADGVLSGNVAVNPYRLGDFMPCSWCPMPGVCRFEMGMGNVRFLETLKRSDVFQRLAGRASR